VKLKDKPFFWDRTLLDGVWSMKTSLVFSIITTQKWLSTDYSSIQLSPT
jgi:hypothetical protein